MYDSNYNKPNVNLLQTEPYCLFFKKWVKLNLFQTGNRLSKRLIEVQLKIIITDAALDIRSRKIQKRPRIGLSACIN